MEILHSQIFGEGKPLLILHGFLGMSDNWKTMGLKYAEQGFEVHLIDQRNHGHSFHSDEFSYELMAEDLLNYIEHHKLGKVSLLGHSMGGKTVMLFAVTHPEKVEHLIVADIAPKYYPEHHHAILDGLNSLDFSKINSRTEADKELAKSISEKGVRMFLLKNLYWETRERLGLRINLPVLTESMGEIGEALPSGTVFNGKTLFLKGGNSEYVQVNDEGLIHNHFPNAKIESVPNAGHWLHAENPSDFYEKSIQFLKS